MSDSLYELLTRELPHRLPLHMPGHKRNILLAPYLRGLRAELDTTEISGFDNLHQPQSILKEGMERAARLYGAERSFYMVNGSTGGILAGMRALSRPGDRVIMQRNCHLSVYQGLALFNLRPTYLYSEILPEYGIAASLRVEQLEEALARQPEARLLVLNCPSYEGVLCDLAGLTRLAHARGLKVLVDAAHGAHLGISGFFPEGATASGADIVIHSLHKTLPSLTQTAMAHAGNAGAAMAMEEQLDVFQSSSPSYLLMASIDGCIRLLEERGEALFAVWYERLERFKKRARELKHFHILGLDGVPDSIFGLDPGKILISCAHSSIAGYELLDMLGERYGIDLEMASEGTALAMSGMGDEEEALMRLCDALQDIEKHVSPCEQPPHAPIPEAVMSCTPAEALAQEWELALAQDALGCICAEYVMLYPPGVPLLVPGELITSDMIALLQRGGMLMKTKSKTSDGKIAVLKACD